MIASQANPSRHVRRVLVPALAVAWVLGVATGLRALSRYENAPGVPGTPPDRWPAGASIEQNLERATLVMLVHPRCPCSSASLEELDRLLARTHGLLAAHVLFFTPTSFREGWARSDLWQRATAIPGVDVREDRDGVEARRFGAFTSGQTVVYDVDGRLVFSGGITSARGHAGDNAGSDTIVGLVTAGAAARRDTPVFGCSLVDAPSGATEVGDAR